MSNIPGHFFKIHHLFLFRVQTEHPSTVGDENHLLSVQNKIKSDKDAKAVKASSEVGENWKEHQKHI